MCHRLGGASAASSKCGIRLVHSLLAGVLAVPVVVCATADERVIEAIAAAGVATEKKTIVRLSDSLISTSSSLSGANLLSASASQHVLFVGCGMRSVESLRSFWKIGSASKSSWGTVLAAQSHPSWKQTTESGVSIVSMSDSKKVFLFSPLFLDFSFGTTLGRD